MEESTLAIAGLDEGSTEETMKVRIARIAAQCGGEELDRAGVLRRVEKVGGLVDGASCGRRGHGAMVQGKRRSHEDITAPLAGEWVAVEGHDQIAQGIAGVIRSIFDRGIAVGAVGVVAIGEDVADELRAA